MTRCNTKHAPWHIVPANHKWYRNFLISRILLETLETMDPKYPPAEKGLKKIVVE
jgi:polyphosphate kinase 2 (PPK2 family)